MRAKHVVVAMVLAIMTAGCGPSMIDVKGNVSYADKPVKVGEVIMYGSDGVPKKSKIDRSGNYEIKGLASGNVRIAVLSPEPTEQMNDKREKQVPDPADVENWFPIPQAYGDASTSGLTATITGKSAEHRIKMSAK